MTWYYYIADDNSSMDIWDHTQDPATDAPLKTLQNDGSGFTIPDDIEAVMDDELTPELPEQSSAGNTTSDAGLSPRGGFILRDLARGNIEEYDP